MTESNKKCTKQQVMMNGAESCSDITRTKQINWTTEVGTLRPTLGKPRMDRMPKQGVNHSAILQTVCDLKKQNRKHGINYVNQIEEAKLISLFRDNKPTIRCLP